MPLSKVLFGSNSIKNYIQKTRWTLHVGCAHLFIVSIISPFHIPSILYPRKSNYKKTSSFISVLIWLITWEIRFSDIKHQSGISYSFSVQLVPLGKHLIGGETEGGQHAWGNLNLGQYWSECITILYTFDTI